MENIQGTETTVITPRTDSKLLLVLAKIVTWIFHPVFMPTVVAIVLYKLSYTSFTGVSGPDFGKRLAVIVINTVIFPLLLVALSKGLGFISSIYMHDPKDRIIPLIGSMIFYFWAYWVFRNTESPLILRILLLGSFWAVIAVFMVNIFYKVSIHTTAAGGVLGIIIVLMMLSSVSMIMPLFVCLILAGLVGTARMLLGAHTPPQIYFGYALGIVVQVCAYWYLS